MTNSSRINYFARTKQRGTAQDFGIEELDRDRHMYMIGQTGTGKSTVLRNMILQDIHANRGVAVIDPHGTLAEDILINLPLARKKDIIYFNPCDISASVGLNILACPHPDDRARVASDILSLCKKLWDGKEFKPNIEKYLRYVLMAVLEQPNATLLDVLLFLSQEDYRLKVINQITDPLMDLLWQGELDRPNPNLLNEGLAPIQSRVSKLMMSLPVRHTFSQNHHTLNLREVMDKGQILIATLPKGLLGEQEAILLGSCLITFLQTAILGRVDQPEAERKPFYLYVDEFHNFTTDSTPTILSEARKYRLSLIMAHQYMNQLPKELQDAIFGNVGTMMCFSIGASDAEALAKEFAPNFSAEDLVNLDKYQIAIKLAIEGGISHAFSATTLEPMEFSSEKIDRGAAIKTAKDRFARTRKKVEGEILQKIAPHK